MPGIATAARGFIHDRRRLVGILSTETPLSHRRLPAGGAAIDFPSCPERWRRDWSPRGGAAVGGCGERSACVCVWLALWLARSLARAVASSLGLWVGRSEPGPTTARVRPLTHGRVVCVCVYVCVCWTGIDTRFLLSFLCVCVCVCVGVPTS